MYRPGKNNPREQLQNALLTGRKEGKRKRNRAWTGPGRLVGVSKWCYSWSELAMIGYDWL